MACSCSAGNDEIGALHQALRSGDVETVRSLGPSCLLWKENSIGWTALHVAASHGWTDEEWLLKKAIEETASSRPTVASSEISPFISSLTHTGGQSCIALFFRRHVDPLPWHHAEVKDAAAALQEDLILVKGTASLLDECRARLQRVLDTKADREPQEDEDDAAEFSHADVLPARNDLLSRVVRFWQRMELWLRAAYLGTLSSTDEQSWSLLHALAFVGGCPRDVAQLAVALYPDQACSADAAGNLPLHVLCSSGHGNDSDCEFLLQALLEVHPDAAKCANQEGRLPLNVALSHGKHGGTIIQRLISAEPLVLHGMRDVVTGLPSFALAATYEISRTELWAQRHNTSDVGSLWHFLPPRAQEERLKQARRDLEIVKLNTIYRMLLAMPSEVQFSFK